MEIIITLQTTGDSFLQHVIDSLYNWFEVKEIVVTRDGELVVDEELLDEGRGE